MDITYLGEHLMPGRLGHFFTILSLTAALLATLSFLFSGNSQKKETAFSWLKLGRVAFSVHAFSVLSIVAILFYMIFKHYFEYQYVWQHSSLDLPVYYMLSCFWEGQEGSFLLWSFWHVVLGGIVIWRAGKWEASVMTFLSFIQIFLAAMLIGIYFFGYKIGSSPFILLRDFASDNPIFLRPNYLEFVLDGNGLNPLLQNYWMVIHPPVLFLGFASTLLPFAYVLSALWKNEYGKDWILPTLKWSLFSAAILGTGILMGGAWAYESLSFGGYWAWDPVENASLVPWIIMIAGIHGLLAYKHSGYALRTTCVLYMLSFLLILYSTFLTRSGILGDTSVHSFTDLGMSGQLIVFLAAFAVLGLVMIIYRWRSLPNPKKEESSYSREFWLFIGSLVLTLVAGIIIWDTSWPVFNKIFGTEIAITNAVEHYNARTIWFGVLILVLVALTQYLKYKSGGAQTFLKKIALSTLVSLVLSVIFLWLSSLPILMDFKLKLFGTAYNLEGTFLSPHTFLMFAAIYCIIANANYIWKVLKGKILVSGGSVAHIGFGMMMLGVLLSSGQQEVISVNTLGMDYGENFDEESNGENVLLYKDKPFQVGEYWVTYISDSVADPNIYYEVLYERKENLADPANESFSLLPFAQINPKMGLIAEPSIKRYWDKDIFTHVSSIPKPETEEEKQKDLLQRELSMGDTIVLRNYIIELKGINPNPAHGKYLPLPDDIAAGASLSIQSPSGDYTTEPIYYIRDNFEHQIESSIEDIGLTFIFKKILPEQGKIQLEIIDEHKMQDFIILKAIVFPFINILWIGCFVMVIGFILAVFHRNKETKRLTVNG